MTQLSDTARMVLLAACNHPDRLVLPLPERLKGGAASKVIDSLAAKLLIEEVDAKPGEPVWRETGDGHGVTLVATDAAFAALGLALPATATITERAPDPEIEAAVAAAEATFAAAPVKRARADSKQAQLIAMLRRPEGATIAEIADAFGWQHHTVRGALAGALKKKLGLDVTSEKVEGRDRTYRLPA